MVGPLILVRAAEEELEVREDELQEEEKVNDGRSEEAMQQGQRTTLLWSRRGSDELFLRFGFRSA